MKRWLRVACVAVVTLAVPGRLRAQFTDPHAYDNTPIGTNQLELAYSYSRANSSIDTGLVIVGATLNLNTGTVDFTRYFGVAHHTAWVEAGVPIAGLSGSVGSSNIHGSVTGTGDSSYQAAILLKGGPALNLASFENYKPTTIVGISISVSAPTGLYRPEKILNLGSDRWSFKPELAFSHPFGSDQQWQLDLYANAEFYTDNTSYRGRDILRQEPLPGFEAHLSYSFNDAIWASLDTRYSFRGSTSVNGVDQNDGQRNFILGNELNIALNKHNTLVLGFAKAMVYVNGPSHTGFTVKYDYTWGKGYRPDGHKE